MKRVVIIVFLITQSLLSQVQFEAKVSKTTLGLNERLRIDFVMNMDGDNFNQPSFEGFRIIAGPSQQVSQSWINGKSSFEKIYTYFLLPSQKGILVIKQASIEYNGQIYKTSPIKINVTGAVEAPRDPNDTQVSANDNVYLVADISKSNPYVNEPITVVYKLYLSSNIYGISNWRELDKPKYNNFWSQNIDIKQLVAEEGMFKGEKYHYIVLRKTVLYPQKSGKLVIEPLSLDIDVQMPSNRRDMFGQMVLTNGNKRVSSGSNSIAVRALPETGKPADFSGAVGKFDFKVTPSKTDLKNGESLDLVVSVTGSGNMKLFTLPKPVVPNSLEMYDAVHNEKINTSLSGMSGKVSDSYTIIPQFKGKYPIKPLQFSYFDLGAGTYKTVTSSEIMINVLDGPSVNDVVAKNTETTKSAVSSIEQFKYIKLKSNLTSMKEDDFFGSNLFYGLLFLPFLILPMIILFKKKKEAIDSDVFGNRIKMNNRLAKKYLSEAKKQINNKEPFYVALEKAMHNFLKAKLHIETSEMSKSNIQELLLSRKANPKTVNDFINLTENCELARFAQSSSTAIQQDFDKAVLIIADLEKQI